jgi:4-amino-4-deoxy-L-arabinose transferase-like glycosyltransferase
MTGRLRSRLGAEGQLVLLAVLLAVVVRVLYVLATRHHVLAGDEVEYDLEARFAAQGNFLQSTTPYGISHASTWKAPGYAAFLGAVYWVVGNGEVDRALIVQSLICAPLAVLAVWQLGRRLFTPRVGVVAAFVLALYPNAWQYDVRVYSEALSNPLSTLTLALLLPLIARPKHSVPARTLLAIGLLFGLALLIRPSAIVLVPVLLVLCWRNAGAVRGTVALAAIAVVAAVLVAPWSVRNARLDGPWVPLSVQSAAAYGVFNDDAAHDAKHRWAWRPLPTRDRDILLTPRTDGAVYRDLTRRAIDYVKAHPSSVPQAFWANGVRRLYELRAPHEVLNEVRFEGRTRAVTAVGLAVYYPLALLALLSLWQCWSSGRRALVVAVVGLGLACSVAFTTDAGTRYRAPLEPLIVVLAVAAVPWTRRVPLTSEA